MKKLLFLLMLVYTISVFGNLVTATEFQLKDQFQKEHTLEQYKGKKVYLTFWTSWCGYCKKSLEDLKVLYEENGENKKNIIFLTFNDEEEAKLKDVIKEKNYNFPIINDKVMFYKYYIDSYPTTYLINEEGKVVQVISGYIEKEEFKKLIKDQNYKAEIEE